jgi:hypothetical protein
VQDELLDKHPDTDLRIYAVWFSMYPTDRRDNWPPDALTDRRVVHWWDEDKVVGRWYMQQVGGMQDALAHGSAGFAGDVLWDAYMVYGPDASWESAPSHLRRWGRTILGTKADLREAFDGVLSGGRH